jgi:hypothetical protein
LYKAHSVAEDARDVPGLLATLTPDCVYEIAQTTHRWTGHTGATAFYRFGWDPEAGLFSGERVYVDSYALRAVSG